MTHIREQVMAQMSGSSGRQRVPADAFGAVKLAVPETRDAWEHEASVLAASFAKSRALWLESRALTALRDTLMPELLSGRLRAPDSADPEELIGQVREDALA
jgi:type I restriction enzyme S subunit